MTLNISFISEGTDQSLREHSSSDDLLSTGKVTFEETKWKPNFCFEQYGRVVGIIHLPHLSVYVDGKPFKEVTLLPKEITLDLALRHIKQYGEETAESLIRHDRNDCLWFNILNHFGSFDAIKSELPSARLFSKDRGG